MTAMSAFVDAARRTELFSGLETAELDRLARSTEPVAVRESHVIFREDDPADRLYVIESGTVRIAKGRGARPGTYARFLATLEAGEVLGEMALVLDAPRSATAIAKTDCTLHALSRSAFDDMIGRKDEVAVTLLRNLAAMACRRLERTCESLVGFRQAAPAADAAGLDRVESSLFHRSPS
jgi:CRP-like cAMP-binding protein